MIEHTCTRHQPGTYACYVRDACKCGPCRTEGNRRRKLNAHRRDTDARDRTPAGPIRAHVTALLAAGMGRAEIARLADIDTVSITRLLDGQCREMRRDRAARIAAVRPVHPAEQKTGLIDACGLIRRVEALALIGWSTHRVMDLAGLSRNTYAHARRAGHCYASSRAAVTTLYDTLWDTPPPPTPGTAWVSARARREGYQPAAAWDDGTGPHGIDNPHATPSGIRKPDRARSRYGDTAQELADAIEGGASAADLEARFGMSWAGVERALARAGHHELANKVRPLGLDGGVNQYTRRRAA